MSVRDYIAKDFYAALGVPKSATAAEIKKAYRKLARELHPDKNDGNPASEDRFKDVSEAYDVLSDEKKRAEYDEARALFGSGGGGPRFPGGGPSGAGGTAFDIGDLLNGVRGGGSGGIGDVFGGLFGGAGRRAQGPRRGQDVESAVTLDFAEAVTGVTVPLRLRTPSACSTCSGSGAAPGTTPRTCPVCSGAGTVSRNQGGFGFSEPCRDCRGSGRIIDAPCPTCSGSGTTMQERTLSVRIPPGVEDGQRIRLAGRGMPGERGGPAGDLFVVVHVTPHLVFGRRGDALTISVPLTFPEAALGATVPVPTLTGSVSLKVPPGTANGRTFRVRGRGVPRRDGTSGDLLATVEVAVPAALSGKAKELLAAFAEAAPHDPREPLREAVTRA